MLSWGVFAAATIWIEANIRTHTYHIIIVIIIIIVTRRLTNVKIIVKDAAHIVSFARKFRWPFNGA